MEQTLDSEEIIERVAALDIGKATLVCCVRTPADNSAARRLQDVITYSTMTRSLMAMADRLRELGVTRVVMEATSDYWKPAFYLLGDKVYGPNGRYTGTIVGDRVVYRSIHSASVARRLGPRERALPGLTPPDRLSGETSLISLTDRRSCPYLRRGHYELATETARPLQVAAAFTELAQAI